MQQLTTKQLKEFIDNDTPVFILDVREAWEFELCHIDESINIPMAEIPASKDNLDPEKLTVVICHHGMRSFQVAQYLEAEGFKNIKNLEGGIAAWAETIDSSMAQY